MAAKIAKLLADDPPKKPLESLDAVVDDWIYRFGKGSKNNHMRDGVVEYCRTAPDLMTAVYRACDSRDANGKMHNHQSRVLHKNRMVLKHRIERLFDELGMLGTIPLTFDDLYDQFEAIKPYGVGLVTVYDVATRVAAFLKLDITTLYLHAGVRIGWYKLHNRRAAGTDGKHDRSVPRIPREELPKALRRIPADEVEDMLCCYRDVLKPWLAEAAQ